MNNRNIKILVVDDHPLFRAGLISLVQDHYPVSKITEASCISETLEHLENVIPDVAILDVSLPDGNGLSLAEKVLEKYQDCRVYILSMHKQHGMLKRAKRIGCRGYFLKEGSGQLLLETIADNEAFFIVSPQLESLLDSGVNEETNDYRYGLLTHREREVFRLFASGLNYKEVAWKLGLSPRTSSVHKYNIFQKLQISNDVELANFARDVGLLF